MQAGFLFTDAPFASAHASTIVESGGTLLAAWFGGPHEGHPEVGIWLARREGASWSAPVEVAQGRDSRGRRSPCWNPVLCQPRQGPLLLFYKVGPSPRRWWGMLARSSDGGRSWSEPARLPRGILGPIKNKPVELEDGALLCPSSTESLIWRCHLERTADGGASWQRLSLAASRTRSSIQPSILRFPDGTMQLVCRSRQRAITTCRSADGLRWDRMRPLDLPNPDSGIDAQVLADGRALLVYNHSRRGRTPLNLALSRDGRRWQPSLVLEDAPGEYSYPAVIQAADGLIHITYTWQRRRIRHVELDPAEL
ncbi:MAG TPA: sialidase family protein [Geminicoccaceae bacterium]|nr:sialidase family protein [Geminicoccaceae bacterium]